MVGTLFQTASMEFIEWLLKTEIVAYDQYLMCIFEYKMSVKITSIITKYLSNINEKDYLNVIRCIANYVEIDNVDIGKEILKMILAFKYKPVSNEALKKHFILQHRTKLIDIEKLEN